MTICPEKLDPANRTDSSVSLENANQTEASSLLGHGFAWSHFDRSEKFFDLLLDSPTGLLESTDGSISSNAQMDLLLTPDFSSPTAFPPSRIPVAMIARKNGSLIAAWKRFLGKLSDFHLQRIRIGQVTVGRIAKKRIFHLDFISALNDGAGNTFLTIRWNCA